MEDKCIIVKDENGIRIDKFISDQYKELSREYIKKIIKSGDIKVNEKVIKPNYIIKCNDKIDISIPQPEKLKVESEDIPIDVMYEDDDIIIVNKAKGMVVHPAPGNYNKTLVNALLYYSEGRLSQINGVIRPGIVHRIDKNTSGVLVVAKNNIAHMKLSELFKQHNIKRKYHAIVYGNLKEDKGIINLPIGRNSKDRKKMAVTNKNSKNAITKYKVLERFKQYTYIECTLETGRTHQIRVHMAYKNHPLLGDDVYGPKKVKYKIEGQVLHAKILGFIHPISNKYVEFESELPQYFKELLVKLRNIK